MTQIMTKVIENDGFTHTCGSFNNELKKCGLNEFT